MAFLGNSPTEVYKSLAKQTITGDGSTSYALDHNVGSAVDLEVFVNNVRQEPDVAYTASGANIVFTTALEATDECYVIFQGKAISSNSIQSQNIADGSITADKTNFIDSNGFYVPTLASDPSNPIAGQMYYNTTQGIVKNYDGSKWHEVSNTFTVNGGNDIYEYNGYKIHVFTSSGTLSVNGSSEVDIMLVAGGAAGGMNTSSNYGGGGGAGGLLFSQNVTLGSGTHQIVVGAGGTGQDSNLQGNNGGNSTFLSLTAIGGGGGGTQTSTSYNFGKDGGSGGGGSYPTSGSAPGGAGTAGQGNAGGRGDAGPNSSGGGGGAGQTGFDGEGGNPPDGGDGLDMSSYFGTTYGESGWFAGGGAGTQQGGYTAGTGGLGGGGDGAIYSSSATQAGTANTGGGGAGGTSAIAGRNGGSGIVIIRYPI